MFTTTFGFLNIGSDNWTQFLNLDEQALFLVSHLPSPRSPAIHPALWFPMTSHFEAAKWKNQRKNPVLGGKTNQSYPTFFPINTKKIFW